MEEVIITKMGASTMNKGIQGVDHSKEEGIKTQMEAEAKTITSTDNISR
jgi:hypothetical protein